MADFEFDDRAVKKAIDEGVRKLAADLTRALDGLVARYEGRPLEEIKPEIQRVWSAQTGGGQVTDPELTQFAQQIHDGGRVVVKLG